MLSIYKKTLFDLSLWQISIKGGDAKQRKNCCRKFVKRKEA